MTNHKKGVRAMALHHTEFTFASASADSIKKWEFPGGNFLDNFDPLKPPATVTKTFIN